jgi:mannose-6-phosphate isomerase
MIRLHCIAQQYEWGRKGMDSAVARLKAKGESVSIEFEKPYAEYWFGTHPSGPSKVHVEGKEMFLQDYILSNMNILGEKPVYNSTSALPYLFKVLSVGKALSIQAHPDKTLAKQLFHDSPNIYKDDNHKPEMACALTPFDAMCGFRSLDEICGFLVDVPEFGAMVGEETVANLLKFTSTPIDARSKDDEKLLLREMFQVFMSRPDEMVVSKVAKLEKRVEEITATLDSSSINVFVVVKKLLNEYPNDIGVFGPFFFNLIRLQPGEAIYLGANEPHAYLHGDCVEVMACSDNVIRAGLTPKFKDVKVLCSMLTYNTGMPKIYHSGTSVSEFVSEYSTPAPEFMLHRVFVPRAGDDHALRRIPLPPISSAAILVVISGSVLAVATDKVTHQVWSQVIEEGQVWLQPATCSLEFEFVPDATNELLVYRSCERQ